MKFKKLYLKNIRSFKEQEFIFPDGSLLVSGDIGAGKTSILLAIEYALFGLQPGQKGNSLLRNNEENAEVILDLEIDGKLISLERKLKRTSKGVSNEYAAITIDGVKEESSVTEIKHKIITLLGYPEEFVKKNNMLYRYTVYTPQEQMKQIILEDAETRINILRHVFGVDKYKTIKENLVIVLTDIKNQTKILQGEIASLEEDKKNLERRKINLKEIQEKKIVKEIEFHQKTKKRKEIELEIKELEKKIDEKREYEKEIEKTKILLVTKRERNISINLEIEDLAKFLSETKLIFEESVYEETIKKIISEKAFLEKYNGEYLEIASKINSLVNEREDVLRKKERIFRIEICPTCLQDVSENHKHNITNETDKKIVSIKRDLEEFEKNRSDLQKKIIECKKNISDFEENKNKLQLLKARQEHIEKAKIKTIDLEKQKQTLEEDEKMLASHSAQLKEQTFKYSIFENQYRAKSIDLKEEFQQEKYIEITLAELKKEAEWENKEIENTEKLIERKEQQKKKLREFNELIDWLGVKFLNLIETIERSVLLKLRSEFSLLFRKWFLVLIAEGMLDARVDENFTPVITQNEAEMDYSFLSGGERTAVALAYRLALNQTINSLMSKIKTKSIIILDEPTDGFSEAQIDKVRDILAELNAEQLILVSHEQKVEGFVDNVVKIKKEESGAKILSN